MTNIKQIAIILTVLTGLCIGSTVKAQQGNISKNNTATFSFYYSEPSMRDSSSALYCKIEYSEIEKYDKIKIAYDDISQEYLVKTLTTETSGSWYYENGTVYFHIDKILDDPFVVITAIKKDGTTEPLKYKNFRGDILDPHTEGKKWEKQQTRLDSLDYVHQFNHVYKGKDGKPRFRGKDGKTYIVGRGSIEEDTTPRPDKSKKRK